MAFSTFVCGTQCYSKIFFTLNSLKLTFGVEPETVCDGSRIFRKLEIKFYNFLVMLVKLRS